MQAVSALAVDQPHCRPLPLRPPVCSCMVALCTCCAQSLDSPVPISQGLPSLTATSSSTPYMLHPHQLQPRSQHPAPGRPLDTALLLQRAQQGADLLDGIAHAGPRQQPSPPLLAFNGGHEALLPPWQHRQPLVSAQQPTSGQHLNMSTTAAMPTRQPIGAQAASGWYNDSGSQTTAIQGHSREEVERRLSILVCSCPSYNMLPMQLGIYAVMTR